MTTPKERFSAAGAIAWYLCEDRSEVERRRRYQPTRTPCAVYSRGNEYFTATSSAGRKPRESNDNQMGYWKWEAQEPKHPYGWVIWLASRERED